MASLNMAKVNTLFRKGYLLAGVIIAANMFVGNEVRAMIPTNMTAIKNDIKENKYNNDNGEKEGEKKTLSLEGVLNFVLSWENTINLVGGVVSSVANNYLKWWDYNPGGYSRLGCFGWRSGRLINIFQILQSK